MKEFIVFIQLNRKMTPCIFMEGIGEKVNIRETKTGNTLKSKEFSSKFNCLNQGRY